MIKIFHLLYNLILDYNCFMIDIEILNSPDEKRLGRYVFHKDEISFGSNLNDELLLDEEEISPSHISIVIKEFKLYVHLREGIDFILVNGKRTTAAKLLKATDTITIGKTTLKINNFLIENHKTRKEFLNAKVEEFKKINSPLIPVLQILNEQQ